MRSIVFVAAFVAFAHACSAAATTIPGTVGPEPAMSTNGPGAGDPVKATPSARSPVTIGPRRARLPVTLDPSASRGALHVDLGPLPAGEKRARLPRRTSKRRPIGIHRSIPSAFAGDLAPELEWVAGVDGHRAAVVAFHSDRAVSVRIAVHAALPPGASIQVFDSEGAPRGEALAQDAFDVDDNTPVWLPSVAGDTLIVQITVPSADAAGAVSFTVVMLAHRYESRVPRADPPDCAGHVNVQCETAHAVRDAADSTGRILFEDLGMTWVCSGTLLNASDGDGVFVPYFLTANHCVPDATVAATVEAAWFWQVSGCKGSAIDDRVAHSFAGTDLLATSRPQDMSLLRFREALPGGLSYSGWDIDPVPAGTAVFSVHFPNGFAAQYAEGSVVGTGTTFIVSGNAVYDTLEVDWSRGLTEGGSSGAGLFDGQYLVGVLSGGEQDCSTRGDVFGPFRDFFPRIRQWIAPPPPPTSPSQMHALPVVPGAGERGIQGFVRIINRSDEDGVVHITAIDDTGMRFGPVSLAVGAMQARQFNSSDLEQGNASIGLDAGVGDGVGMWRLELGTDLNIDPRAYIRTPDGFLTSMHLTAATYPDNDLRYYVPIFNPASNTVIRSLLRVINPNATEVDVLVEGRDADGYEAEQTVGFSLVAGVAVQITSRALEEGDTAFTGRFGDGRGKWEISVTGSQPLVVMSLLSTLSGHLSNVSR